MNIRDLMNKLSSISEASTTDFANSEPAPAAAAPVDPAKEHQYRRAQQAMANLEKAAQYSGTDEIVRQRAGLPPQLPSIDQWDGKMPEPIGRPDWFNRWFGQGGGMTGDVEQDQTQASAQNAADASTIQTAQGQLKQLNDLVAKLGGKPAPDTGGVIAPPQQSAATTGTTTGNRDGMSFGQAFADARKKGEKTFTWRGKTYSTDVATDKQQSAATTDTTIPTTPGFANNGGGAAFGNPNLTRQGKKAGAVQEGSEFNIASQLVESFGYAVREGDTGQLAAGGVAGHLAGKAASKMGARFIPGVATGFDVVDAAQRVRDKDYVGAGIAATGAVGGLVPGWGGAISGGAAGINLGRDINHAYQEAKIEQIRQMQKELGVPTDGTVNPVTVKALKKNPKVAAKYGYGADGKPLQKESVAEGIASLRDRLAMIEAETNEANYVTLARGAADVVDATPKIIRQGEKFMGMAREVPKPALPKPSVTDVVPKVPGAADKAKNAAKSAASWVKANPNKSTLAATAAGAALGYGLTRDGSTVPAADDDVITGPHGRTGDRQTPDASVVGDTTPAVDPAVADQIQQLMSALAQVNDPEIQQGLDQARTRVNAFTGGKPLTDFIKK